MRNPTPLLLAAVVCGSFWAASSSGAFAQPDEGDDDGLVIEDDGASDDGSGDDDGLVIEDDGATDDGSGDDSSGGGGGGDDGGVAPTLPDSVQRDATPVSWQDIVTVIRKPFLKVRRTAFRPMFATTMNDNMVRHYGLGGELSYFLSDNLAVGVEGQYFLKQFREPFDLVARQARRLPTVNKYNFSASLNFHYVPVYGKFAVLDKKIITWESYFTAGVGVTQSEVIPRDTRYPGFTNLLITPSVGASLRFFLFKWMTVDLGVRDYIFIDKFEPTNRSPEANATAEQAKDNADSALINNVMFQLGLSFWFPTSFEYTTFR